MADEQTAQPQESVTRSVTGTVVSDRMDKTITVLIERKVQHPVYGKIYARNPDGSLILTKIDEESLRGIAAITNGEYFRATDAEALSKIYAQILELERTKFQVKQFERATERFRWAAVPAVLLVLLELGLAHTRLRVLP